MNQTVWKEAYTSTELTLDGGDLDALFEQKANAPGVGGAAKAEPKAVSLIDGGKSRNLAIILSQFKEKKSGITRALKTGDAAFFEQEQVHSFLFISYPFVTQISHFFVRKDCRHQQIPAERGRVCCGERVRRRRQEAGRDRPVLCGALKD